MITVVKLSPTGEPKIQYTGEIIRRLAHGIVISAFWRHPPKDLGYTRFEPGDHFTEYYYADRWYNIFDIVSSSGQRKGWYCNIAKPAIIIDDDRIEQVDLLLDVWVDRHGVPLVLDEDEFAADASLSEEERLGARQGLRDLLQVNARQEEPFVFMSLPEAGK